jgi:cytochrome c oxidase subunit I+III
VYNFAHTPVTASRHPLWDTSVELPVMTGLRSDRREVLVTTTFDARPDHRHEAPEGAIWPLYLALCMGVVFIGSIFSPYYVLGGLGLSMIGLFGWAWKSTSDHKGPDRVVAPEALAEGA